MRQRIANRPILVSSSRILFYGGLAVMHAHSHGRSFCLGLKPARPREAAYTIAAMGG